MLLKKTIILRSVRAFFAVAIMAPMLLVSQSVLAQDQKKDVNKIEVKDGKVFVNGDMVKELADKDLPIMFRNDGEDTNYITLSDRSGTGLKSFSFYSDDDDIRVWSRGARDLFELKPDDGNVHVFGSFPEARMRYQMGKNMDGMRGRLELLREGAGGAYFFSGGSDKISEMEMKSHKLARKIRNAEDSDKAELETELDELLDQIFDEKLEVQQERVNNMTEELQKLRGRVDERRSSRQEIIRRRLSELLGSRDAFDW